VPGLQERLATLCVDKHRVVNLEMETSLLFHLAKNMGYNCGSVCAVIANRPQGTFLEDYSKAIDRAIQGALFAIDGLSEPQSF